jgi:TetR/AcrR family transcriptional regulator
MTRPARERLRLERKAQRHQRQRDLILQAARELLESGALATLTIDQVAETAGIGRPSVFYYFSSKQELVGAVVVELAREECQALIAALERSATGVEALVTVVRTLLEHYRGRIATFRAHYLAPQLYGILREHLKDMAPYTSAFFAACVRKTELAKKKAADLTALAWTTGIGILFRASLLEPAGVKSDHAVADLEREAIDLLRRAYGSK